MSKKIALYEKILEECHKLAQDYVHCWKPTNSNWQTVNGSAYIRLSTNEQLSVAKGSLEQQIHITYEEMQRKSVQDQVNYRICEFFIERPLSGQRADRPEFLRMRREIRRKKYGFVSTKEVSRLARSQKVFAEFLDELKELDVKLIIPGFPVDPNDAGQRFMIQLMASVAEWEAVNSGNRIAMNNRAALKNNGKFNSTHNILGLDRKPGVVGLYSLNKEEQSTVEFVFQSFISLRSEEKVLDVLKKKQVLNKNSVPFTRASLHRLLRNTKLIGEWQIREKGSSITVKLPHGLVVSMPLWEQVQAILATRKSRNRINQQRIYPLSGILLASDNTSFRGFSGTGRSGKFFYYRNEENKICIPALNLEELAIQTVNDIISGSKEMQESILKYRGQVESRLSVLVSKKDTLIKNMKKLQQDRLDHAKTISMLFASDDDTDKILINELKHALTQTQESYIRCEAAIQAISNEEEMLEAKGAFTWRDLVKRLPEITQSIHEHDPKLLKGLFASFFAKIVVEVDLKNEKQYIVKFFISDPDNPDGVSSGAQSVCGNLEMVEAPGVEPGSASDSR